MPRQKRNTIPGATTHIISRFVNGEYRLRTDRQRAEYLRRVARAARRFDWRLLAYALMSTHIHWVMLAARAPIDRFFRSLHTGFANWLNDHQDRDGGPVFAARPKVIQMPIQHTLRLIAYVHNNPCRAGVADDPLETTWTSHRAYLGLSSPPRWLDIETGYALCDLRQDPMRGRRLDAHVRAHSRDPRDPLLSGDDLAKTRVAVRNEIGPVAELGTSFLHNNSDAVRPSHEFFVPEGSALHVTWTGDLPVLLHATAELTGITVDELRSNIRTRRISAARQVVILAGHGLLKRRLVEVAACIGISLQAGSYALHRALERPDVIELAKRVALRCRDRGSEPPTPSDTSTLPVLDDEPRRGPPESTTVTDVLSHRARPTDTETNT